VDPSLFTGMPTGHRLGATLGAQPDDITRQLLKGLKLLAGILMPKAREQPLPAELAFE